MLLTQSPLPRLIALAAAIAFAFAIWLAPSELLPACHTHVGSHVRASVSALSRVHGKNLHSECECKLTSIFVLQRARRPSPLDVDGVLCTLLLHSPHDRPFSFTPNAISRRRNFSATFTSSPRRLL